MPRVFNIRAGGAPLAAVLEWLCTPAGELHELLEAANK